VRWHKTRYGRADLLVSPNKGGAAAPPHQPMRQCCCDLLYDLGQLLRSPLPDFRLPFSFPLSFPRAGWQAVHSIMNELVIEAGRTERHYWADLWRYRELFFFLSWRDILVRYKQTVIGVAWAVIRPFLTTIVLTVVFNKVGKLQPPPGIPYFLIVLTGTLPWQFFSSAMSEASNSLVGNANLISKIYFPRLIVPASSVITSFVDFLITLGLMALAMIWFRYLPDWRLLTLPLFIVLAFGASFGIGLWFCALNVEYRDFRYIIPFIVTFGIYLSPVGFVTPTFSEKWQLLYSLNPMVGVIDGCRWALLRGELPLSLHELAVSVVDTLGLCATGVWYFRKMEKTFADVI
jgi:lipopolysaccharide transport system permease protein